MAKKTAVNKKSTAQGYTFSIAAEEVLRRVNFGTFEVILTKRGAMFKTYTGYHIWCTPYAANAEGKASTKTLYAWLMHLIELKDACSDKKFAGMTFTDEVKYTNEDYFNAMCTITEANLSKPLTIFVDAKYAQEEAFRQLDWLSMQAKALEESMSEYKATEEENQIIEIEDGHERKILEEMKVQYGAGE